jgi:superfamily II DNA or RNA helicase
MWTLIKKENIPKFLDEYSHLEQHDFIIYENEEFSFLPRLFYKNYPSKYLIFSKDDEWSAQTIKAEFTKQLRPYQNDIILDVEGSYNTSGNLSGIIKSNPGSGKTVMGIYLAVHYKLKTMIVVDQSNLVNQWVDTIINFTNIPEERIGYIQGPKLELDNCDIIIAMAQTLVSRLHRTVEVDNDGETKKELDDGFINGFYETIRDCGIDLVLYDECHVTGSAKKFTTSSFLFNTNNIIGLSATPFQDGLAQILMTNTVGDIISESVEYEEVPAINFVKYHSNLPQKSIQYIHKMNNYDFIAGRSAYNKMIVESKEYISVINKIVNKLIKNKHVIIIIAFTKKQVELISESLDHPNKTYYAKKNDLDKEKDNIIVSTYSKTGKGFDMPRLSAAILASPLAGKKSLIQVIGRIVRSANGKQSPTIYDLIDLSVGTLMTDNLHIKEKILENEFIGCEINHINNNNLI